MDRTTVVFVGAHDRSGSTLLDRMLGELPGCVSVGEIRRIWDRGLAQNQLCGCGQPFGGCEFWRRVLEEAFGDFSDADADRMRTLARQSNRARAFPGMLIGSSNGMSADAYREALRDLYLGVARVSGCNVIVDSSKDAVYGALLRTVPGIDVRYLHLVRDARAVAFSQLRRRQKPEIHWKTQFRRRTPVASTAVSWDLSAIMWSLLARRAGAARIRYEDLAREPRAALTGFVQALGDLPASGLDRLGGSVRLGLAHTVSGAAVRFHRGPLDVRPDTEWRRAMTSRDRLMVTMLTWPGLVRFGYPLGAETDGDRDVAG